MQVRKGFSLLEVVGTLVVVGILLTLAAPKIKAKIYEAKVTKLANNIIALKDAESQFNSDTGSYAYAPRCFVDKNWGSYDKVCGDPDRFAGPYVDMRVSGWVDCTLDPTASQSDKAGCFEPDYGDTVEITDTKGTHGAVAVTGLDQQTAYDVYSVIVGKPIGTKYSSDPSDSTTGAWVEKDATSGKYTVYVSF